MERYDIRQGEWMAEKAEAGDFVLYADAQATVEALQRQVAEGIMLREDLDRLRRMYQEALQRVEALQRERDEADYEMHRQMVEFCQYAHEIAPLGTRLPEAVDDTISFGKLKDVVQTALDAERVKVQVLHARTVTDTSIISDLQHQLSQLQALVRKAMLELAALFPMPSNPTLGEAMTVCLRGNKADAQCIYNAYVTLREALDATPPAPRQRQVHSCEIPGCVSCANPEEGGDGE